MNIRIFIENDLISAVDDYKGNLEDQRINLSNFREFASEVDLQGEDYVALVNTYNHELLAAYEFTGESAITDSGVAINDIRSVSDRVGKKIAKELDLNFAFPGWKARKLIRDANIQSWVGAGVVLSIGAITVLTIKKLIK